MTVMIIITIALIIYLWRQQRSYSNAADIINYQLPTLVTPLTRKEEEFIDKCNRTNLKCVVISTSGSVGIEKPATTEISLRWCDLIGWTQKTTTQCYYLYDSLSPTSSSLYRQTTGFRISRILGFRQRTRGKSQSRLIIAEGKKEKKTTRI